MWLAWARLAWKGKVVRLKRVRVMCPVPLRARPPALWPTRSATSSAACLASPRRRQQRGAVRQVGVEAEAEVQVLVWTENYSHKKKIRWTCMRGLPLVTENPLSRPIRCLPLSSTMVVLPEGQRQRRKGSRSRAIAGPPMSSTWTPTWWRRSIVLTMRCRPMCDHHLYSPVVLALLTARKLPTGVCRHGPRKRVLTVVVRCSADLQELRRQGSPIMDGAKPLMSSRVRRFLGYMQMVVQSV